MHITVVVVIAAAAAAVVVVVVEVVGYWLQYGLKCRTEYCRINGAYGVCETR